MAAVFKAVVVSALLGLACGEVQLRQVTPPGLHTEGPVWDEATGGLLFVDISGQLLHFYNPYTNALHSLEFDGPVSPVLPLGGGRLAVGVGRQIRELNWAAANYSATLPRRSRPIVLATLAEGAPGDRFNDGKVDSRGRIWVGTMGPEPVVGQVTPDQGALYRVTLHHHKGSRADVKTVVSPVSISNGLAWNAEETLMYYIDTPTRRVDAFDYDLARGKISNRRTVFDFSASGIEGYPDGMTVDADGNLWVACFAGSQVIQVDPREGRLLRRVAIPASQVTSVALGGPVDETGDTLYVTTMRKGLSQQQLLQEPAAGAVFAVTGLGVLRQELRTHGKHHHKHGHHAERRRKDKKDPKDPKGRPGHGHPR